MIIEGEWRETSLAFIDFIKINYNEDPYDYMKCMETKQKENLLHNENDSTDWNKSRRTKVRDRRSYSGRHHHCLEQREISECIFNK